MSRVKNSVFSKAFWKSLLFTQNKWHQHGVLIHTIRVTCNVIKAGEFRFFLAALLHDIGKPYAAFKKDEEDIKFNEYSFTDHEERSYQIIKNWYFLSSYTKKIVRYHYLIRDLEKSKKEDIKRYESKKKIWDKLSDELKNDLAIFLIYDDKAKGKSRRDT